MSLSISSPWNTSTPTNLVFIDPSVDDFGSLLKGLKSNSEAIILDSTQDGVAQISNFLASYQGAVESVQILSHGAAGQLQLGASSLSLDNLEQYKSDLGKWFSPSSIDKSGNKSGIKPDLILYGCVVAEGDVGQEFINKLSQMTGADVAASTDLTGSAAKGGNWILEKATGVIEAASAFSQTVKDAYKDLLATFTVTNSNDAGAGSLRQAILSANANPGPDDIFFDPSVTLIRPNSPLPIITDQVNLDGRPGQSGTLPGVEINGINAGTQYKENSGIQLYGPRTTAPAYAGANGSTIRGLSITGFWGNGLLLFQTDNNTVEYNHIGADATGTVARGNSRANDAEVYHALLLRGSQNNIIQNNLVSGNFGSGIVLFGSNLGLNGGYPDRNGNLPGVGRNSNNNQILNNITGLDITRNRALSNERIGIFIEGTNNLIEGNFVAGNGMDSSSSGTYARGMAAEASPATNLNTFRNNIVGTNPSRTVAIPNRTSNGDIEDLAGAAKLNYFGGNSYYGDFYGFNTGTPKDLGGNFKVTGIPVPTNPVLTPIAPQLTTIVSSQPVNNGDLIDTLVGGSITSTPGKGIAVTAVGNTGGTWEFSTNNGASWSSLKTAVEVPPLAPEYNNTWPDIVPVAKGGGGSPTGIFMLAADGKNRIRFVPNVGFSGPVTNDVTYMAWNQVNGGNGAWTNIKPIGRVKMDMVRSGFSMNNVTGVMTTDRLSINVLPGNAAPVLDPLLVQPLAAIAKDPVTNPGTLVSSLIPGAAVTDLDAGALKGIAVTGVDNSNGTWQYALDGVTWTAFGAPDATNARLLRADATTRVRFVPNAGYEGAPSINFRAWDQVIGTAGGTTDVSTNGGVTAFSTILGTVAIAVGSGVVPPPVVPPGIPVAPAAPPSPPLDPGFLPLLKNPPPAPQPKSVVAGEAPLSAFDNQDSKSAFDRLPESESLFDNESVRESRWARLPDDVDYVSIYMNDPGNPRSKSQWSELPDRALAMSRYQPNPVNGIIRGTRADDALAGTDTANTIFGLSGNDNIVGTPKRDNLLGGPGNDRIRGLDSRDFIRGGSGNDKLFGGRGSDVIFGEKGNDTIYGGRGNDFISGGNGRDTIYGDRGNDLISGGKGNDRLFGGAGNDLIYGDKGNDTLRGNQGNDLLDGGKGNDLLIGGQGNDLLTGGKGKDRFRFAPGDGTDTITDFALGKDVIELSQGLKFSDLQITQGVGATVIGFQPGTLFPSDKPLVLLAGVNAASLTPNSFSVV